MHATPTPLHPTPLSLVLLCVEDSTDGVTDELLFEAILYDRDARRRAWRRPFGIAVLRASDELDAVLWAGQIRERLHEHGLRVSAGVSTQTHARETVTSLVGNADWALDRARHHGGDMVLAHSTTLAVRDARPLRKTA